MFADQLQVQFLKGTNELDISRGLTNPGISIDYGPAYTYEAPDGCVYLYAANTEYGRKHRYYFERGDITSAFPNIGSRDQYMAMINKACGETVAIPRAA